MSFSEGSWWEGHPELLPPDPELEPLHQRNYQVRAWRMNDSSILIRGAVMDLRPGAPFAERLTAAGGDDDGSPLAMHHMVVDLVVEFPELTITDARVLFEKHPQPGCPAIAAHYRELIGLSIARGFTHEVRRRFGGPRGCTHTTALLQAMSPVAVQCIFSMRRFGPLPGGPAPLVDSGGQPMVATEAGGEPSFMRDTCHVWSADGELWQEVTLGRPVPLPLPMQERLRRAGLDPDRRDII